MCKQPKETRTLVLDVLPDLKLWRIAESGTLELRFDLTGGRILCHQSDDAGHFAKLFFANGHYPNIRTALNAIHKGGLP